MKKLFILLFLLSFSLSSYSQSNQTIKEAQTIYFYGYDFTKFKLINPKKVNKVLIDHAFGLSSYLNEKFPSTDFSNNLKKTVIYNDASSKRNRSLEPYSFGAYAMSEPISKEACVEIISEYEYSETEGIGLIVLMEYANKIAESSRIRPIFFDLKTREIIYSQPIISEDAKGTGFTRHWGKSFMKSMKALSKINYDKHKVTGWETDVYKNLCGEKPVKPPTFNNPQYKQSKAYKKYKQELANWNACNGN